MQSAMLENKSKERQMGRKRKFNYWPYLFALPFCLFYGVFSLFPTVSTIFLSFYKWDGITKRVFTGFSNYVYVFTRDPHFFKSIGNDIIIMLEYIPFLMVIGVVIAAIISSQYVKFGHTFRIVSCLPYITMSVAIGLIFSLILDFRMGMVNQTLSHLGLLKEEIFWLRDPYARPVVGILMIWRLLGYTVLIYGAGMLSIPNELYEAASIDGATGIKRFFKITIPLLMPTIKFLIITNIIGGFQLVEEPMLLLNGWGNGAAGGGYSCTVKSCLTPVWYIFDKAFGSMSQYGVASAMSFILFMVILIFSLTGFRLLTKGSDTSI